MSLDADTLHYFWQQVWWALVPKAEIIDNFRYYGGVQTDAQVLEEVYERFLQQKQQLLDSQAVDVSCCERLFSAFTHLNEAGIVAIHNAGSTLSAGVSAAYELRDSLFEKSFQQKQHLDETALSGYCFYHEQDIEHLCPRIEAQSLASGKLHLAFGSFDGNTLQAEEIGKRIVQALRQAGLHCEWDGSSNMRIAIPSFIWVKANDESNWEKAAWQTLMPVFCPPPPTPTFEVGTTYTPSRGLYRGLPMLVQSIDTDTAEITLEVSFFGRKTPIAMPLSDFAALF